VDSGKIRVNRPEADPCVFDGNLSDAYVDAWQKWSEHGEARAWEPTVGDGLLPLRFAL
jgi:hypothetical protein